MYEQTTANFNSCESDIGKWGKSSESKSLLSTPPSPWAFQSLRMGCPACDRRRSRVCDHQTADSSNTAAAA